MTSLNERRNIGPLTVTGRPTSEDEGFSVLPALLLAIDSLNTNDPRITQEEGRVTRQLVESWMDRLQLISVLAIFFASTEATLLSITMPAPGAADPNLSLTANAGLTSGLVLHILAAFISFLGGFYLIQYKIKWASVERNTIMKNRQPNKSSSEGSITQITPIECDIEHGGLPPLPKYHAKGSYESTLPNSEDARLRRGFALVFTEYPGLHPLPTKLLGRFHFLCVVLTLLGFMFTLVGIVCNAWERLPQVVGIVCTIAISVTLIVVFAILILPDTEKEEPN